VPVIPHQVNSRRQQKLDKNRFTRTFHLEKTSAKMEMNIRELKESTRNVGGFNPQHLSESRGYDGKRIRKAIQRRTVDYNSDILRYIQVII
jgi:hypothetical protein